MIWAALFQGPEGQSQSGWTRETRDRSFGSIEEEQRLPVEGYDPPTPTGGVQMINGALIAETTSCQGAA